MNYYADFINKSDRTWTMGLYQKFPDSPGLDSVSWLQTRVPEDGESGVSWEVNYQAMLADYKITGGKGVYKANIKRDTLLNRRWRIIHREGVQQLVPDGEAELPNQITISNESGDTANPGIGMSGEGAVFKREVLSGTTAQFLVTPVYYAAIYNDVRVGEVISSNVLVRLRLEYPSGFNLATIKAVRDGGSLKVDVAYGRRQELDVILIEDFIRNHEESVKRLAA